MNFHIFKLFAFVFLLVVFVFKPISAKPQTPPVPQMPGMPNTGQMSNVAKTGIDVANGFAQTGMENMPSSDKITHWIDEFNSKHSGNRKDISLK